MKPKNPKTSRYDEYQEREKEDVLDEKVQKYKALWLMVKEDCKHLKGEIEVLQWERQQNSNNPIKSQQVDIDLQSKLDKLDRLEREPKNLQQRYDDLCERHATHLDKTALDEKRHTDMRQELLRTTDKMKQAESGLERMAVILAEVQTSEIRYREREANSQEEVGKWKHRYEEMAAMNGKKAAIIATLEEALRKRSKEDELAELSPDEKLDRIAASVKAELLAIRAMTVGVETSYAFCGVRLIYRFCKTPPSQRRLYLSQSARKSGLPVSTARPSSRTDLRRSRASTMSVPGKDAFGSKLAFRNSTIGSATHMTGLTDVRAGSSELEK